MNTSNAHAARTDMVFAQEFEAPRETVFTAWSQARLIDRWFGPRGCSTATVAMDFRSGGRWHHVMTGPDGHRWHNHIRYVEIVAPARIVYDHHGADPDGPVAFRATVAFTALPGTPERCRVEMRGAFPTAEARDQAVRDHRAEDGGRQTLARLGEHIDAILHAPPIREATISRTVAAPRAAVWRAWVDPQQLSAWWGPRGFTNPVCDIDARVGGKIRIHMQAPDGSVYPMTGSFEELDPPVRLVMRAQALDGHGTALLEIVNTVTFAEAGASTTVTVHARVINVTAEGMPHLTGMEQGWSLSLERLEALVTSGRV